MRGNNDGNDKYQRTAKTRTTVTKKHKLLFFVSKSKRQRVTCSGLRETILSIPTEKYLLLCLLLNVHSKLSWSADNKSLGIASCQLTEEQWLISLTVDSSKPNSDAAGSGYQKIKPHLSGWRRARACGTSRAGLIGYRQHWFWNQSPQFGLSLMLELPWVRGGELLWAYNSICRYVGAGARKGGFPPLLAWGTGPCLLFTCVLQTTVESTVVIV